MSGQFSLAEQFQRAKEEFETLPETIKQEMTRTVEESTRVARERKSALQHLADEQLKPAS